VNYLKVSSNFVTGSNFNPALSRRIKVREEKKAQQLEQQFIDSVVQQVVARIALQDRMKRVGDLPIPPTNNPNFPPGTIC
jgi:hypothetical protein